MRRYATNVLTVLVHNLSRSQEGGNNSLHLSSLFVLVICSSFSYFNVSVVQVLSLNFVHFSTLLISVSVRRKGPPATSPHVQGHTVDMSKDRRDT